jgi:hypothetical protein
MSPTRLPGIKTISVSALVPSFSTRYLLETLAEPDTYKIDFAHDAFALMDGVKKNSHDVYLIDTCNEKPEDRFRLLHEIEALRLKYLVRVLFIIDQVPPPEANAMSPFGPLCFMECFFTRKRMDDTFTKIMTIRDTGNRVKGTDGFFDITIFMRK